MNNREWENLILNHKIAVSDSTQFTSSSASLSCFDPDRGKMYTVYHASRTRYGEATDILMLAIIPISQPHLTENIVVFEIGDSSGGVTFERIIDANVMFLNGLVRISFLANAKEYYYVDFDVVEKTFTEAKKIRCCFGGEEYDLSDVSYIKYLNDHGLDDFVFYDPYEYVINTGKIYKNGEWWYGCLTSSYSYPVIYKTRDGSLYEFVGHIGNKAKYEAQTAIVDGVMYCLLRGAEGDNFYISNDFGKTFIPSGRIEYNETRPQLLEYKGKLLIAVSLKDVEPNLMRAGRNNMKLLAGAGGDLSKYKEIFFIVDRYGIVYYDITDYKGVLYMIWSNSDLFLDKSNHGKDILYFAKIGDISDELAE